MTSADAAPAFLVLDTESVPDGRLLHLVKYPREEMPPEEAVRRAQEEARALSRTGSDFLGASFMFPVAVCILRADAGFRLQRITCLDAPQFRTREIVRAFWEGLAHDNLKNSRLVTFNGRGFDLPLMELAAFRYGLGAREYFRHRRHRFNGHLDLLDWLNNFGGYRHLGGLNLLSKLLGKPGKMGTAGDQVWGLFQQGKIQEINDYCMHDTLDTYFVFLRTRVLTGEITLDQEQALVREARAFLESKVEELPGLAPYLQAWGDWEPWP